MHCGTHHDEDRDQQEEIKPDRPPVGLQQLATVCDTGQVSALGLARTNTYATGGGGVNGARNACARNHIKARFLHNQADA